MTWRDVHGAPWKESTHRQKLLWPTVLQSNDRILAPPLRHSPHPDCASLQALVGVLVC